MERDPNPDPDAEELFSYDHTDASFDADPDVDTTDRGEFEGVDITQSDGPDLEVGDDLDTGAAVSDRRDRS
jgi:hypothetical protein